MAVEFQLWEFGVGAGGQVLNFGHQEGGALVLDKFPKFGWYCEPTNSKFGFMFLNRPLRTLMPIT